MPYEPETRPSLIVRLQSDVDPAAWEEFVAIYRPMIVRLATRRGMQHSDAEDVAQGVLLSVSRSIVRWKLDPEKARFRTWLQQIVRNATFIAIVRHPVDRALGGTMGLHSLSAIAADEGDISPQFEFEWRREVFRWASDEVRNELHPAT